MRGSPPSSLKFVCPGGLRGLLEVSGGLGVTIFCRESGQGRAAGHQTERTTSSTGGMITSGFSNADKHTKQTRRKIEN